MFPYGLPSQFSYVSTFRMSSRARRETWDLLRIEDSFGKPQFGIRMIGKGKQVQLYMPDYQNQIQTVTFKKDEAIRKVNPLFVNMSSRRKPILCFFFLSPTLEIMLYVSPIDLKYPLSPNIHYRGKRLKIVFILATSTSRTYPI